MRQKLDKPSTDEKHTPYTKRANENDHVLIMKSSGLDKYQLVGHGIALDHPEMITQHTSPFRHNQN